ncbi:MAG TPA: ABC transporter substrate-binding protein [Vicinamibacteria bacterium]|nr:ABC transporter substrate-binding protein [Vicinamibacteria bacterium]
MQYASSQLMEEGTQGALEGLREAGFRDGETIELRLFNPEGDMPTANAIANEIQGADYDMVITMGTPAMQAMANANKSGNVVHVFGLVADPPSAGVGISRDDPMGHPKHLVGVGSFLPVDPVFRLLKELNPGVQSVGLVWNAAESNSEAFTIASRKICAELDIELMEANADNSSGVAEAANSLVARGAQALFISGDNTVAVASNTIVAAAKAAGVPSFSILTGNAERGALFELGADFRAIGRRTAAMAVQILRGTDPASIPWENVVPPLLVVNQTALQGLRGNWSLPQAVLDRANGVIDASGLHMKESRASDAPLSKTWKVKAYSYIESPAAELSLEGVYQGLDESGLVKGRDYDISFVSAQGDIATASSILDAAVTEGDDLLISLSTPMLQASVARARGIPVVFTLVSNPIIAGAGKSDTDHLPNITGNYIVAPFAEMAALVKEILPAVKRVGTVFCPAEVNSVYNKDVLTGELEKAGIELVTVGVNSASEVADAALSLGANRLDAIVQIADNLSSATFSPIVLAAEKFDLPLFAHDGSQAGLGPAVILARDYYDGGREAGLLAAEVMRGADPASIPFAIVTKVNLIVDLPRARASGLTIPQSILERADRVIGQ